MALGRRPSSATKGRREALSRALLSAQLDLLYRILSSSTLGKKCLLCVCSKFQVDFKKVTSHWEIAQISPCIFFFSELKFCYSHVSPEPTWSWGGANFTRSIWTTACPDTVFKRACFLLVAGVASVRW